LAGDKSDDDIRADGERKNMDEAASRRRFASLAQICRKTPCSVGSMLSTNLSAKGARASLGSESASAAICSTVIFISDG